MVTASTVAVTKNFGGSPPASSTVYSFSVGGIRNQRTAGATSDFKVTVTDGGNNVESKTKGLTSSVSSVPQFTSFTVTPANSATSASTVYTFQATASTLLRDGDILSISPQTGVTNPTTPLCKGISANLESQLISFIDSGKVAVVLDFTGSNQIAAATSFSFSCETYTNPSTTFARSAAPTTFFSIAVTAGGSDITQFTGSLELALCDSPCATCPVGQPTTCLTCVANHFKQASQCVTSCEAGYTLVSGECQACSDSNCSACNAVNQCAICLAGYVAVSGACQSCGGNCHTCTGPTNQCTVC